ncbi:BACON domain-containing carbohydrate-binding protein [Porphyromonas sp.]|uniref:BACON domain-containing protein n=1 Tax=Porphyromonas sp. TaxID=1924944 RepID=UPI0026DBC33C|nr:BACON domain-containing carbohydrate-binding protein [Porphyromonas sp.]MDO4770632.1 BACON domain-containing carbohydrate-binding protein [Porphyromonas sp.]
MKTSVFFLGILSCLLLLSSCRKDSIDTSSWLKVDADEVIRLESGTGEKIIAVSSSQGQWATTSNADWLEARQAGDYLVLNARPNETLNVRKAQVLVVSSGIKKALQIEQEGYPTLIVETDPAEITFAEEEGQMRLILKSNSTEWTVNNPSEDWIETIARPRVGELVVKVKANETTDARTAEIAISANDRIKTIKVKQNGKLHFFLPFSDWGTDFASVQKRELARKSKLAGTPNPNLGVKDYTFFSVSKVFQRVRYEFEDYGSDMLQATTVIGDKTVPYTNEFHEFLLSEGFERITPLDGRTKGLLLYVHKEKKIDMSIYTTLDKVEKRDVSIIFCRPIVEQPGPMPTLSKFDTGMLRFGEATSKEVGDWEKANGGKYDEDFSAALGTPIFFAENPFYARGYFFDKVGDTPETKKFILNGYLYLYISHELGLYRYGGMEYLTNEFKALLEREGFEFMYFYPGNRSYYFKNKTKKVEVAIKSIVLGPRRLLRVNFGPTPEKITGTSQAMGATESNNMISTNITNVEL